MINVEVPHHGSTAGVCGNDADEWNSLVEGRIVHLHGIGESTSHCDQPGYGDTWMDGARNVQAKDLSVGVEQVAIGHSTTTSPPTTCQLPLGVVWDETHSTSSQTVNLMQEHVEQPYAMPPTTSHVNYEGTWAGGERGCTKNLQGQLSQVKWAESTKELENFVGTDLCQAITDLDIQPTLGIKRMSSYPMGIRYNSKRSQSFGEDFPSQEVRNRFNSEPHQHLQHWKTSLTPVQCPTFVPQMHSTPELSPMGIPTYMPCSCPPTPSDRWLASQEDSPGRVPGHMPPQQQHVCMYPQHHVFSASSPRLPSKQPISCPHEMRDQLHSYGGSSVMSDMLLTLQNSDGVGNELMPFLIEHESWAIALWNIGGLPSANLISMCESYGDILYFRDEFREIGKDVVFVAYYDLRSASRAKVGLQHDIAKLWDQKQDGGVMHHHSSFMIPLPSVAWCRNDSISSQGLESSCDGTTHCSHISEPEAFMRCQEFGNKLSVYPGTGGTRVDSFDTHDVHSAHSAFDSDGSIHRLGGVVPVAAYLSESDCNLGRQLLALLDRWKVTADVVLPPIMVSPVSAAGPSPTTQRFRSNPGFPLNDEPLPEQQPAGRVETTPSSPLPYQWPERQLWPCKQMNFNGTSRPRNLSMSQLDFIGEAPLVCPKPRQLEPIMVNRSGLRNCSTPDVKARHRRRSVQEEFDTEINSSVPAGIPSSQSLPGPSNCRSKYAVAPVTCEKGGDEYFEPDIEKIAKGMDKRSTIMIRNIPNKYTQTMLLDEINIDFKGSYDFFYLPIDFKNRCNVGYAFINFMDFQRIIPFWKDFNGQRWHNFNSEKVCAMSYARIQGKASMISRFQNSSLMYRDDEYRPLLFCSSGAEKGLPELFPKEKNDSRDAQKSNRSRHGSYDSAVHPKRGVLLKTTCLHTAM